MTASPSAIRTAQLALVVGLVGVQLGSGRVADDPQPVGEAQPAVARERRPTGRVDAVVLEPEVVDRERPTDGEQDGVALGGRAVVELDDVGAVLCRRRPAPAAPGRRSGRDAVRLERRRAGPRSCADGRSARAAGPTGRSSSARRTGHRPGRARSRSDRRRGRAGSRGSSRASVACSVGPGRDLVEALDRRPLRDRPDRDDDVGRGELVGHAVVADRDAARLHDRRGPAIDDRAGRRQCLDVAACRPARRRRARG